MNHIYGVNKYTYARYCTETDIFKKTTIAGSGSGFGGKISGSGKNVQIRPAPQHCSRVRDFLSWQCITEFWIGKNILDRHFLCFEWFKFKSAFVFKKQFENGLPRGKLFDLDIVHKGYLKKRKFFATWQYPSDKIRLKKTETLGSRLILVLQKAF